MKDNNKVLEFLNNHFLHWQEVLGLVGEVSEGVLMVTALEMYLAVHCNFLRYIQKLILNKQGNSRISDELSGFVYDIKRLILCIRPLIEMAPLQAYYSVLLFCPRHSIVREKYKREDAWVLIEPAVIQK